MAKGQLETGEVVQQHRLDRAYFAEGLAEWNGQPVQLTWRSNIAFVYDLASFAPRRTMRRIFNDAHARAKRDLDAMLPGRDELKSVVADALSGRRPPAD